MEAETHRRAAEVGAAAAAPPHAVEAAAQRISISSRRVTPLASPRVRSVRLFGARRQAKREENSEQDILPVATEAPASPVTLGAHGHVEQDSNITSQRERQQRRQVRFAIAVEEEEGAARETTRAAAAAAARGTAAAAVVQDEIEEEERRTMARNGRAQNTVSLIPMEQQQQLSTEEASKTSSAAAAAVSCDSRTTSDCSRSSVFDLELVPSSTDVENPRRFSGRISSSATGSSGRNCSKERSKVTRSSQMDCYRESYPSTLLLAHKIAAAMLLRDYHSPVASPRGLLSDAAAPSVIASAAAAAGSASCSRAAEQPVSLAAAASAGGLDGFKEPCRSSAAREEQAEEREDDLDEQQRQCFAEAEKGLSNVAAQSAGPPLIGNATSSLRRGLAFLTHSVLNKEEEEEAGRKEATAVEAAAGDHKQEKKKRKKRRKMKLHC